MNEYTSFLHVGVKWIDRHGKVTNNELVWPRSGHGCLSDLVRGVGFIQPRGVVDG